uniref:U25-Liphistoxin-Lth1a_1 n=1 Tax=Liphistius thaleban TaxID=1905330 RepID=A0A4Q8K3T1_9ARAC
MGLKFFALFATLLIVLVEYEVTAQFTATDEERKLCEDRAKGRGLESVEKRKIWPCYITCHYANGEKENCNFKSGTPCCDYGPGPTGTCENGTCKMFGFGR